MSKQSENMSDLVVSSIRTIFPLIWGSVVAWVVGLIPALESIRGQATEFGAVITTVIVAAWYVLTRSLEPKLPEWLRAALFGVTTAPEYDSGGKER